MYAFIISSYYDAFVFHRYAIAMAFRDNQKVLYTSPLKVTPLSIWSLLPSCHAVLDGCHLDVLPDPMGAAGTEQSEI